MAYITHSRSLLGGLSPYAILLLIFTIWFQCIIPLGAQVPQPTGQTCDGFPEYQNQMILMDYSTGDARMYSDWSNFGNVDDSYPLNAPFDAPELWPASDLRSVTSNGHLVQWYTNSTDVTQHYLALYDYSTFSSVPIATKGIAQPLSPFSSPEDAPISLTSDNQGRIILVTTLTSDPSQSLVYVFNQDLSENTYFRIPHVNIVQGVSAYSPVQNWILLVQQDTDYEVRVIGISLQFGTVDFVSPSIDAFVQDLYYDPYYNRLLIAESAGLIYFPLNTPNLPKWMDLFDVSLQEDGTQDYPPDGEYYSGPTIVGSIFDPKQHTYYHITESGQMYGTHILSGSVVMKLTLNKEQGLPTKTFVFNPSQTCGQNGHCGPSNQCECFYGMTGSACNQPMCYGSDSCSFGGVCVGPNTCDCDASFGEGMFCETLKCNGSSPDVLFGVARDMQFNFTSQYVPSIMGSSFEYANYYSSDVELLGTAATDGYFHYRVSTPIDQPSGVTLTKYDLLEKTVVTSLDVPEYVTVSSVTYSPKLDCLIVVASNGTHMVIEQRNSDTLLLNTSSSIQTRGHLPLNKAPYAYAACTKGDRFYMAVQDTLTAANASLLRFNMHDLSIAPESFDTPAPYIDRVFCSEHHERVYVVVGKVLASIREDDPLNMIQEVSLEGEYPLGEKQILLPNLFVHPKLPHFHVLFRNGLLMVVNFETKKLIFSDVIAPYPPSFDVGVMSTTDVTCSMPEALCFGIPASAPEVCSGRGNCTETGCVCPPLSEGIACEIPYCFGFASNNTDVCSGHGACSEVDQCTCQRDYSGLMCSLPNCYGISATDPSTCNGHGICLDVDSCDCEYGYDGAQCEHLSCFSLLSNDSSVCSGNGDCIAVDWCNCTAAGWAGPDCGSPICHDITATTPTVCSARGVCSSPDYCTCDPGFTGEECQHIQCFDHTSNETDTVCSGRGYCSAPNQCECYPGYSGEECQNIECFGFSSNDTANVCSGKGTCVVPDYCECSTGWGGITCAETSCFGLPADDYYVCGEHGSCVGPNDCACDLNFFGEDCSVTSCFGTSSNDSNVCLGRGICYDKDSCACDEGFEGNMCENYFCDGFHYSDPAACNSRGNCTTDRICSCEDGYSGSFCDLYSCFGKWSKDADVCFGHGVCSNIDTCDCVDGFGGEQCGSFTCFDIEATNTSHVCSGRGSCVNIDTCVCPESSWTGAECELPVCYGVPSTNTEAVCSSHGTCASPDTCVCDDGYTRVSTCALPECFGILSNESSVCSSHGSCVAPDSCMCEDGYFSAECNDFSCFLRNKDSVNVCWSNGNCTQLDTCVCEESYTGLQCQIPICFGKMQNESDVCSSHGSCTAPDQCVCSPGWAGSSCQHPVCFGESVAFTGALSTPCNGFPCTAPDTCSCSGYLNADCSVPICFGQTHPSVVCSNGAGTCSAPNTCTCSSDYYGTQCEYKNRFFLDIQNTTSIFITDVDEYLTGKLSLNTDKFKFYGQLVNALRIGENGFITFGDNFFSSTVRYDTYTGSDPLVLFGLSDMDLMGSGATNRIYFRQSSSIPTTNDLSDLSKVSNLIKTTYSSHPDFSQFSASWFFVTSADKIGYYPGRTDKVNSVQVILTCDETRDLSFVIFNFKDAGIEYPSSTPKIGLIPQNGGVNSSNSVIDVMSFADPVQQQASRIIFGSNTNKKGFYMFPTHLGDASSPIEVIPTCNGILANETSAVCNGGGNCTDFDVCQCEKYHSGSFCELSCVNQTDYTGERCETVMCYGLPSFDLNVCSGHGACSSPQNCSCETGYYGDDCSLYNCYSTSRTSSSVCSGHGSCTAPDTCSCASGWVHNASLTENDCSQFTCSGKLPSDPLACSNGGDCIGKDECTGCDLPFYGDSCKEAIRYVDSVNGNSSTSNLCLYASNPCKSITHAISVSFHRNVIRLASGTYSLPVSTIYITKSLFFIGESEDVYITTASNQPNTIPSLVMHLQSDLELTFNNIKLKNIRSREFVRLHYPSNIRVQFNAIEGTNMNGLVAIAGHSQLTIQNSSFSSVNRNLVSAIGTADDVTGSYAAVSNVTVHSFGNTVASTASPRGLMHFENVGNVTLESISGSQLNGYTSGVHVLNSNNVIVETLIIQGSQSSQDVCGLSVKESTSVSLNNVALSDCVTHAGSGVLLHNIHSVSFRKLSFRDMTMRGGSSLHLKTAGTISIPSLHFSNITAHTAGPDIGGGGLYIQDTTALLEDFSFDEAQGIAGMGIYAESSHITLLRNSFHSLHVLNTVEFLGLSGAAIIATGTGSVSIRNGTFIDNHIALIVRDSVQTQIVQSTFRQHKYGTLYSISNRPSTYMLIQDSIFEDNSNNQGFGGAVTSFEGYFSLVVRNSAFTNCSAVHGGAISLLTQSSLLVSASNFTGCSASSSVQSAGGAIQLDTLNSTTITECSFVNNTAEFGGAIQFKKVVSSKFFLSYGGSVVRDCKFIQNQAKSDGGALEFQVKNIANIHSSLFESNRAGRSGGAVFASGEMSASTLDSSFESFLANASFAELMFVDASPGLITENSSFISNYAEVGGAVTSFSNGVKLNMNSCSLSQNSAATEGGSLYLLVLSAIISESEISHSSALRGGCIFVLMALDGIGLQVRQSKLQFCTSAKEGGSIYLSQSTPLHLSHSLLTRSSAARGNIYSLGPVAIHNSQFLSNQAVEGAALMLESVSSLLSTDSLFRDNVASANGGVVHTTSYGMINLTDSQMIDNRAAKGGALYLGISSTNTNSIPDERPVFISHSRFANLADVGGSFFSFGGGFVNWNSIISNNQSQIISNSSVVRTAPVLGYGAQFASNPRFIRVTRVVRYDVSDTGGLSTTEFNSTTLDSIVLFPGQAVDIYLDFTDAYGQVVSYYPGLTMLISSTARFRSASIERVIENEEVIYPNVQIFGVDENTVTFSAGGVTGVLDKKLNFVFTTCPHGYRTAKDECQKCPKGSYNIIPGSTVCYTNCDGFNCEGGSEISVPAGVWLDINSTGAIRSLPCVNGKCAGGDLQLTNQHGTALPFSTEVRRLTQGVDRYSGLLRLAENVTTASNDTTVYNQYKGAECTDNRQGILCAQCADGYNLWRGACMPCEGTSILLIALYCAYTLAMIAYVHYSSQNDADGASDRILVSFIQTTLQCIDLSTWASKQASTLNLLGVITDFLKAVFNLEIPSLSGPDTQKTEFTPPSEKSVSFYERCPFERKGYWFFSFQLFQHVATMIFIFIAMFLCLFLFKTYKFLKNRRARRRASRTPLEGDQDDESIGTRSSSTLSKRQSRSIAPIDQKAAFQTEQSTHGLSQKALLETEDDFIDDEAQNVFHEELKFEKEERLEKEALEAKMRLKKQSIFQKIITAIQLKITNYIFPHSFVRTFISILIYTYMPLVSVVFSFLLGCFSTSRGNFVLIERTDLACWTTLEYWAWAIPFFVPAFIYLIVGPFAMVLFLRLNKKRLQTPRFKRYFGTLYTLYKPDMYWFESVAFARRTLLIGASIISNVLTLSYNINGIQYILYTCIIASNYLILLRYNPYAVRGDNTVEKLSFFMLFLMLCVQEGTSDLAESVGMLCSLGLMAFTLIFLVYWTVRENALVKKVTGKLSQLVQKVKDLLHKKPVPETVEEERNPYMVDVVVTSDQNDDVEPLALNNFMQEEDIHSSATTEEDEPEGVQETQDDDSVSSYTSLSESDASSDDDTPFNID